MNFTSRKMKFVLLVFVFTLLTSACSNKIIYDENGKPIGNKNVEPMQSIDEISLREMKSVYDNDDDSSIVTMYLTVSKGNSVDGTNHTWGEINTHSVYYYQENGIPRYAVEGILQVGDEYGPLTGEFGYGKVTPNSTVSVRGQNSSKSAQKSYKISIRSSEGLWREQTHIALNKHVYDTVRFRNKLSYDLLKTIPSAFSTRTQFVRLYVKDLTEGNTDAKFVDHGLYTQVEQFNKKYLRARGLDENGQLYKAINFNFQSYPDELRLINDPEYDFDKFESILETRGSDDHSKMIAMLADVNDYSIPIEEIFGKYFDEENYFTWLAFQLMTGNKDTVNQNFFLYSPLNAQRWYFISWDNDSAWESEQNSVYDTDKGYNYTFGLSNYWGSVIHKRVLSSPEYRKKLDDKVNEIRGIVSHDKIQDLTAKYDAVVRPYIFSMPDLMHAPKTPSEYEQILEMIPKEAELNYQYYQTSIKKPMPFRISPPVKEGAEIVFSWEDSYDMNGGALKYTFELASDYHFTNPIMVETDLGTPTIKYETLPAGQYFQRVSVSNESGETGTAMGIYKAADDLNYYGVKCFYIGLDGSVRSVENE